MRHSPKLIARIKGLAYAGVKPKALALLTGISVYTIQSWLNGRNLPHIEPDPATREILMNILKKEGDSH